MIEGHDPASTERAHKAGPGETSPCVSVIMANCNRGKFIASAIESVLGQSLKDLELLVSDDGSTDESVAIVERFAASDERVRLLRSARKTGAAAARNRALQAASGRWLAIVDSDDLIHPARLETLISNATRDGADIAADDIEWFYEGSEKRSHGLLSPEQTSAPFWIDLVSFIRFNTSNSHRICLGFLKPVIRADRLKDSQCSYDETLIVGEDYDLMLRLLASGLRFRVYPERFYFYRKHDSSLSYRHTKAATRAMLDADRRCIDVIERFGPEARAAFEARNRSIRTTLNYCHLREALKSLQLIKAAGYALRDPGSLLMLKEPVLARLKRLIVPASVEVTGSSP
jgi:glycosyltransferase involved in cell wall biosynthesis